MHRAKQSAAVIAGSYAVDAGRRMTAMIDRIWLESIEGEGTTVYFTLPGADAPLPDNARASSP